MANRFPLILDADAQRIKELPSEDNLDLSGTGAVILPVGTTAQRPFTPVIGMFRFNIDILNCEVYDGAEWREIQSGFSFQGDLETLDGTEDLQLGSGGVDLMS